MSELTQDKVNEIVRDRLKRERLKHEKEVEQLKGRIAELTQELEDGQSEPTQEPAKEPEPQQEPEPSDEEQEEYKRKYFDALKQKALIDAGFTHEQLDRYTPYLSGDTREDIERSALELSEEVSGGRSYVDPVGKSKVSKAWNPFA
ncbi:hypothetical protein [Gracilibacillus salinarum]|uniref:DUF4355 domain-containing protein n=1 Tax=Gracilibacillus salinarum TaxID=2932255 RepID=A0ABY4GPJ8_9BACI|nr:hypothetical protein [Gracilibacillus salinarum]UOQ86199.1 hypothetical protein MUN87_04690 [Gracilibacillus salinarum]